MNRRILNEFRKIGMQGFWGNYFDSRFYIGNYIYRNYSESILDVGCGTGILLSLSKSKRKIGVDISLKSLREAKKLDSSLEVVVGDATKLPFIDGIFERVVGAHLIPDLKILGLDWKKSMSEIVRVSNQEIILSGNNRLSRHHDWREYDTRKNYLRYDEQVDLLKNNFDIEVFGYDPHSKFIMYPIKKILYKIPDSISEILRIDQFLYRFLKSKRYFKNGRSYVIICKKIRK